MSFLDYMIACSPAWMVRGLSKQVDDEGLGFQGHGVIAWVSYECTHQVPLILQAVLTAL